MARSLLCKIVERKRRMSATLPNLDHITLADEQKVYIPSDDTFLLCDSLHSEAEFFFHSLKPSIIVEMGCGSGCVITYLTQLLLSSGEVDFVSYGIDINMDALTLTRKTYERNVEDKDRKLQLIHSDLFSSRDQKKNEFDTESGRKLDELVGNIDILIFNPPYVPSEPEEVGSTGIEASYAGGIDGREVIDEFLPQLPVSCTFSVSLLILFTCILFDFIFLGLSFV
jgi:release factor glutamine methyltransferase